MTSEQYTALFPVICADVVQYMMEQESISESKATESFYKSRLYNLLEQEDMKLWQYSTPMLYTLLTEERRTGKMTFPDT